MESEVRRDGRLGGQAAEVAGGREHAAEAASGRRHAGQCGIEGPFGKEMVTPAAERKAVANLRAAFGMSERLGCKSSGGSLYQDQLLKSEIRDRTPKPGCLQVLQPLH